MVGEMWRRKGTPISTSCREGCFHRGPLVSSFLHSCQGQRESQRLQTVGPMVTITKNAVVVNVVAGAAAAVVVVVVVAAAAAEGAVLIIVLIVVAVEVVVVVVVVVAVVVVDHDKF
eukprot:1161508-Pelagomonas_calceolata.AAC.17